MGRKGVYITRTCKHDANRCILHGHCCVMFSHDNTLFLKGMQSVQQQSGNHSDSQLLDHGKKNDSLTYHGMNLMDLVSTC